MKHIVYTIMPIPIAHETRDSVRREYSMLLIHSMSEVIRKRLNHAIIAVPPILFMSGRALEFYHGFWKHRKKEIRTSFNLVLPSRRWVDDHSHRHLSEVLAEGGNPESILNEVSERTEFNLGIELDESNSDPFDEIPSSRFCLVQKECIQIIGKGFTDLELSLFDKERDSRRIKNYVSQFTLGKA